MRSSILYHCLLLVCINLVDVSAYSGRSHTYSTSSPLEGDSIKFPRKPLTKTQAAYYVFDKRWFSVYVISNPPFETDVARDLELFFKPRGDGSFDEYWDARKRSESSISSSGASSSNYKIIRFGGVCLSDVWLFEPVAGESNRAVYTFDGPFPITGKPITISFFSSNPWNYIFIFECLDRDKEIVRDGKRVSCEGPYSITFLTNRFPPNRMMWCEAEEDLKETLGLTFYHEFNRFDPTLERCNQEPLPP